MVPESNPISQDVAAPGSNQISQDVATPTSIISQDQQHNQVRKESFMDKKGTIIVPLNVIPPLNESYWWKSLDITNLELASQNSIKNTKWI